MKTFFLKLYNGTILAAFTTLKKVSKTTDKIIRSDEKVVKDFTTDEKVIENSRNMANFLHSRYGGRWITPSYVAQTQKVLKTESECAEILMMLSLTGFAISNSKNNIVRYRITLSTADKKRALEEMLSDVAAEHDRILKQLSELGK